MHPKFNVANKLIVFTHPTPHNHFLFFYIFNFMNGSTIHYFSHHQKAQTLSSTASCPRVLH